MRLRPLGLCVLGLASLVITACSEPPPLTVITSPDDHALVNRFFEFLPIDGMQVVEADDPQAKVGGSGFRVALVHSLEGCPCDGGTFRIDGSGGQYTVRAADALGLQYGLAEVLEAAGVRFFHPRDTWVPEKLTAPEKVARAGETQTPELSTRAIQFHTLHPIEAYFDFWEPSAEHLEGARRTMDWVVKNRGNMVQYPALDNVMDPAAANAWREHTRKIIDDAHALGLRIAIGVQLFGKSNLQKAFDLIDDEVPDPHAEMKKRLEILLGGMGFDSVSLSFGEFSAADPSDFVAKTNLAYQVMQEVAPGVEVTALIHVGNKPDLRVTYMGETLLYYFLVKYADPHIVPWVHSVMFYNLFEDAGGAYEHDEFDEHRAFLLDRLNAGQRVAYFPEAAYWIAFDDSVPTYLPLYVRSRWLDLSEIRKAASKPLREHALFSTGWEWGYWQTDYATLRMSFRLPDSWDAQYAEMFAPFGDRGAKVAAEIGKVGELEHDALITKRLAPYLAGRDQLIDAGRLVGIISQPDRVTFDDLDALAPEARDAFEQNVVIPMQAFADGLTSEANAIEAIGVDDNPWLSEVRDGVAITAARARFVVDMYRAVLAHERGVDDGGALNQGIAELDAARKIVARRHSHLHAPDPKRLITNGANATVYQYGYLREANSLCFWNRERVQVMRLVKGSTEAQPACVL